MTTTTDLVKAIRAVAASKPDFIYTNQEGYAGMCSYFGEGVGKPEGQCCIVGQALKNLEVDTTVLQLSELDFMSPTIDKVIIDGMVDIPFSKGREVKWLNLVQACQDAGYTWAESVTAADKEFPLAA